MQALITTFLIVSACLFIAWIFGYIEITVPQLKWPWLIVIAFLPRLSLHYNNTLGPQLISAQIIILIFLITNRKLPGFYLVILGLLLNMTPVIFNGGLMPVDAQLMPSLYQKKWEVYDRIGWSIVLPAESIYFYWLTDWIFIPIINKAYSPGDFLILAGALWLLVGLVKIPKQQENKRK